ncbi:MAG: hypothetical protein JW982_01265 [Spirochaetes bacterium]|nr:hypothetical protein [Spirochaetota bacterium]
MHHTSINISLLIMTKLKETSEKYCISRRKLVSMILYSCHENFNFDVFSSGLTNYQKIAPGDEWKCMRIDFDDTQCDIYFFYRNRFRISLSKLIAVGFILFFDKILKILNKDNEVNKKDFLNFLNSYTKAKCFLIDFVKDAFKFFIQQTENKT